ncbi:MAG: nucleotidyltransferase domain-containing protein [Nitrospirota bacterium]|nr:nucleotidyltransferase domain-containing protein [Nitrospirota bacterium]
MDIGTVKKVIQELMESKHGLTGAEIGKNHVIAIYLFGSLAKGTEKVRSDIDLAFVFDERFYKEDPFRALQEAELLGSEISKKMHKAVDVVILNGSSLSFAYYTVRNGLCLYESSAVNRILYEVTLDNKYQDFMPFIKDLREAKRKALIGRD